MQVAQTSVAQLANNAKSISVSKLVLSDVLAKVEFEFALVLSLASSLDGEGAGSGSGVGFGAGSSSIHLASDKLRKNSVLCWFKVTSSFPHTYKVSFAKVADKLCGIPPLKIAWVSTHSSDVGSKSIV